MAPVQRTMPDEDGLVQYLLGDLPASEVEALDERAIADDEFAAALAAVENDLVDAYVRGELTGERRERFVASYLATPHGREKVAFAGALHARARRAPRAVYAALAVAALLIVAIGVVLLQPSEQPSAPPTTGEQTRTPQPSPVIPPPQQTPVPAISVVAFTLSPATRDAGRLPAIELPANATEVMLRLRLDADDFPRYSAAVKDLASDEIVHRTARVRSTPAGNGRVVTISVPAPRLRPRNFVVELSGHPSEAPGELVSSYPFRVVLKP